jgi:hypothetical protein
MKMKIGMKIMMGTTSMKIPGMRMKMSMKKTKKMIMVAEEGAGEARQQEAGVLSEEDLLPGIRNIAEE